MTHCLHIIFDLDGTLLDTEFEISRISAELAHAQGVNITADRVFTAFSGMGSREKFAAIAATAGTVFSEDTLDQLSAAHRAAKAALYDAPAIPLIPAAAETLEALQGKGHVLSLASTNLSARSRLALLKTNLLRFFGERIAGPDQVENRKKPDPAVFLFSIERERQARIAAQLKKFTGPTVIVEDSPAGIKAGHAAGAFVVAYLDPHFGKGPKAARKMDEMKAMGANVIIRDLRDLPRVLPKPPREHKLILSP